MENRKETMAANILRISARFGLLVIGAAVTIFALLSGSEAYGGGTWGVIQNSLNALPWFTLLILVFIAWRWELIGGAIITAFGLVATWFFNVWGMQFYLEVFLLTTTISLFGIFFMISWYLRKKQV